MAYVYQNDSLGRGIEQAGGALSQALAYRTQQNRKKQGATILEQALAQISVDPMTGQPRNPNAQDYLSVLNQATKAGVEPELLKPYTTILAPLLKEQARSQGVSDFFTQWQPQKGPASSGGIDTAKAMSRMGIEEGAQEVMTPQGSFEAEEFVEVPGFGSVHPEMISAALRDPRSEIRAWGEGAQKSMLEEQKKNQKIFESDRNYHSVGTKKIEEKISSIREALPRKKMALSFARNAVETDNLGAFSKDSLANIIGGPVGDALRTAKGAQLITASKENLLSNMSRVSARAQNQWFEQRLNSMFPKIGQSLEANLTTQEMLEAEVAMEDVFLKKYDQFLEQDEAKYGYARKDIEKRARDAAAPEEEKIMRRANYRMKQIEEQEMGRSATRKQVGKEVIKGTPLTLEMAKFYVDRYKDPAIALKVAQKNGYSIPSKEEVSNYRMRPDEFMENN